MSSFQQGPDWWQASDGQWYPPELRPGGPGPDWWQETDGQWYPPDHFPPGSQSAWPRLDVPPTTAANADATPTAQPTHPAPTVPSRADSPAIKAAAEPGPERSGSGSSSGDGNRTFDHPDRSIGPRNPLMPLVTRPASEDLDERVVRVFVSSTFRDMAAERDVLVRKVFPQVREFCAKRGVTFTEIDLRWGLTDEQVAEGQVLPLCLAEIDRCKPFFVGLLGERYGWVPDELPDGLADRHPWLLGHTGSASVTELEILYGVLNDPQMEHNAFFYLRDPAYIGSPRFLADTEQFAVDRDAFLEDPDDPASAARTARLEGLKDRLRVSGHPVRERFTDPDQVGEWVLADLIAAIDQRYPEEDVPDPWDTERLQHEYFAKSRSAVYVGGTAYKRALDDFLKQSDGGAVVAVLGASGLGKSALLATWVASYRSRHPETLVMAHYAGSSARSAELGSLLGRLNHELGRALGLDDGADQSLAAGAETPDPAQEFRGRLAAAGQRGRVVLVLDALNQLDDDAKGLGWLAETVPAGVTLVVSTVSDPPDPPMGELDRRGWLGRTVDVYPLEHPDRRSLIGEYLGESAKQLSGPQINQIVNLPQSDSPLYLRVLLDELRTWGRHESLTSRLRRLTQASTIAELLELVLEGYERDFDKVRPGLTRDLFSALWASRSGLSERELSDMLGENGESLPAYVWGPLRAAAAPMLIDQDGLLAIAHAHIAMAIRLRYLETEKDLLSIYRRGAMSFVARGPEPRSLHEAPYHLVKSSEWKRLAKILADPKWFVELHNADHYDLAKYLSTLRDIDLDLLVRSFEESFSLLNSSTHESLWFLLLVAGAFHAVDMIEEAESVLDLVARHSERLGDTSIRKRALLTKAGLEGHKWNYEESLRLLEQCCQLAEATGDSGVVRESLSMRTLNLLALGRVDEAFEALTVLDGMCETAGDRNTIEKLEMHRGYIALAKNLPAEARSCFQRAGKFHEAAGRSHELCQSIMSEAIALAAQGEFDECLRLIDDVEVRANQLGDLSALHNVWETRALIFTRLHDSVAAAHARNMVDNIERQRLSLGAILMPKP